MRRKGEKPLPVRLDAWTADHPVANSIADGSDWFDAWLMQRATPIARLAKQTGISGTRLLTIAAGDQVSQAEVDALARAWSISSADLIASMPDKSVVRP